MKYRIQIFYSEAGCFMNTNHETDDLEQLKQLACSDTFAGVRNRVVDETDATRFEPPDREVKAEPTVADIAAALGVPVLPPVFLNRDEIEKDRIKVGCMLQVGHKLPESPVENEPFDSPEAMQRLKESSDQINKARIANFYISEAQARKIVSRLWPGKG